MPKATSAPIRAIGAPTGPQRKKRTFVLVRDLGSRIRELSEFWIALLKPLELLFPSILRLLGVQMEMAWPFRGLYTHMGDGIFLAELLHQVMTGGGGRPTEGIE